MLTAPRGTSGAVVLSQASASDRSPMRQHATRIADDDTRCLIKLSTSRGDAARRSCGRKALYTNSPMAYRLARTGDRSVRGRRRLCAFASALLLIVGRPLPAQELKPYSGILPAGAATVGPDWAEILFPPQEPSEMGCVRAHWRTPQQGPVRVYSWGTQT